MGRRHGARRAALVLAAAALALLGGCGGGPFDDYHIRAVELRQAPRLEFLRARVGMKFLEVRFEFENQSSEPLTLKALDFALRDTAGRLHPYSAQTLDLGQPRGHAQAVLEPGQVQAGSVVFQIPSTSDPAALVYRQDVGGGLVVNLSGGD